ncbi:MAG: FGGY family carbohydrate kinase [Planctomycetaceae bacterium]
MRCLGLDIGSSSIKGAVLELDTSRVSHIVREPFPDPVAGLPSGFHEVSPEEIFTRTVSVIDRLCSHAPDANTLLSCGQMGGIMLVDQELRPVTNYLSWRDQRTTVADADGTTALDRLRGCWSDAVFEELGKELKPGSATSLLYWMKQRQQLPAEATPITIGDYVIARLCHAAPQMERTQGIGMLNLRTNAWHQTAFAALGLDGLRWPELTNEKEPVGSVHRHGRTLTCYPVIGDQQAALRGISLQPHELSINASTGSQVSQITPEFRPADCQTRPWFDGQFLNTITHIPAGRSLTVLESLLTELPRLAGVKIENSWQLIQQAAENATGEGLSCDLSFFASAMGCDGRINGITTENFTVGNLFLAAFEFMADSYLTCSRRMSPQPTWDQLAVSGGLVQSFAPLRRKIETRFPFPVRDVAEQEETLMGLMGSRQ